MHNNYYFLRQISAALRDRLTGTVISECYSQARDEVIFRFETHDGSVYIRASLGASLSLLSFPAVVERSKRNNIDLFQSIVGYRITGVRQYRNERSMALELEEGKLLLFKMHGNRSNVITFENGSAVELFRKNLPGDASIDPSSLDREIDWSYDAFLPYRDEPEKIYFTLGKVVWTHLKGTTFVNSSPQERWQMIQDTVALLESPSYYLTPLGKSLHLTLLPFPESKPTEGSPLDVSNRFFHAFTQKFALERERANAISILKNRLVSGQNYCEKNLRKLTEIERDSSYRHWADLIMANMHVVKQGMDRISLPDFYHDQDIDIPLKKDLSPQANAAVYYRKAKNQHVEITRLEDSIRMKEKEMMESRKQIAELESISDLKTLRRKVAHDHIRPENEKSVSLPYHEFIVNGFRIWVGKTAADNDELTLKYAYKEDLWLHAKDVAGSHVIIKHQSGKNFPKDVIERAAQLAAYNSKRKTESLCPVIVTPKKFVRKRKGDPAGAVVVEREEVILVEPKL